MARALPILPAEVFDYACALTSLTVYQYAVGCLGSVVPVAFWTYTSAQATSAAGHSDSSTKTKHIIIMVINMVMLLALSAALAFAIKKADEEQFKQAKFAMIDGGQSLT